MDHSIMVSAGIEKFYTPAQFLTVLFLTLSLLLAVLLAVFIGTHSGKERTRSLFLRLLAGLCVFLCAEIALAVVPTPGALAFWITIDFLGMFLFSRTFIMFCLVLNKPGKNARFPAVIACVEAFLYCLAACTDLSGVPFFHILSPDLTVPGPFSILFLSETLGWMAAGAVLVPKTRGRGFLLTGAFLFIGSLFLHHLLRLDNGAVILPAGLLGMIICWRGSFITFNFLGLFLDSFEGAMDHVPMFIAVTDDDGRFLSVEGNAPEVFCGRSFEYSEDLAELIGNGCRPGSCAGLPEKLRECRFAEMEAGRIRLDRFEPAVHLAWSVRPVRYRRKNVAWILTFRDVTVEEEDIRRLSQQEKEVALSFEKLKIYRKTGLYLEIEGEREKLMNAMYNTLETLTGEISSRMSASGSTVPDRSLLREMTGAARRGLKELRMSVNRLKKLQREELE